MLMDTSGRRRLMALVAVSAIAISACGSGGGTAAPAASAPAASAPAASEPAASAPASAPAASSGASRQHRRDLAVGRQRAGVVPEGPGRLQRQRASARRPTSRSATDYATVLQTRITGGNPPDVSILPGIGFLRRFARDGSIKKIADLGIDPAALEANYAPGILDIGKVDDALYAIMVKFNSKSTLWYRPDKLTEAGVTAAQDVGRVQGGPQDHRRQGHQAARPGHRARHVDADRLVREHLPPPGRRRQVRPAVRRARCRGPIRASRRRSTR